MLTLSDVSPERRRTRPTPDSLPTDVSGLVTGEMVRRDHALMVPASLERADRMRLEESLVALGDDGLKALHVTTEVAIGLTQRGAAAYADLERGLALIDQLLAERGIARRRAGRRTDPLCTAMARLKVVTKPVWSDHVAAMHRLVETARNLQETATCDAAAQGAVAAARAAPSTFGRCRGRSGHADWPAVAGALVDVLTLASSAKGGRG